MPNCKYFLVTVAERKHVRRRARFQQHGDTSCQVFFPLQGKAPKEIHAILTETLGEHAPSYGTVINWVAQFKRDFSTCDAPRPGRPKTVTTPEIFDHIHELILEHRQISAKSIGIAAHTFPKYSECKNRLENFSPRFFGIKKAPSSFIIFQKAKLSTPSVTHLCWCNCRTF